MPTAYEEGRVYGDRIVDLPARAMRATDTLFLRWTDAMVERRSGDPPSTLRVASGCETRLDGQLGTLDRVTFRAPGRFRLAGWQSALELAFRHRMPAGTLVLVATFVVGAANHALDMLIRASATAGPSPLPVRLVDLVPLSSTAYAWQPPSTPTPQQWLVLADPVEATLGQLRAL